jgi:TRAP-type mannitol/chloroaromatic compound transport system permease small subunit
VGIFYFSFMLFLEEITDKFSKHLGKFTSFILILMMINVAFDALNRYVMNTNYVSLQEMEWHLFSVVILLGLSYALNTEGHVRVDIFYTNFKEKTKAMVNMVGVIVFILPLALLVAFGSFGFVEESYNFMEKSGSAGGLPYRFIIKSLIPISFFILIFTSVGYFARNYNQWKKISNKEEGS